MSELYVLHVDHSTSRGGAEYALLRMLLLDSLPWCADVLVPRDSESGFGVYEPLAKRSKTTIVKRGPAQVYGASSAGVIGSLGFAIRAIGQAVSIRTSRQFRRATVVHANTSRSAVYAALASLGSRKTLVVHLRDIVDERSLGRVGLMLFTKLALRRANGIIGNSKATLESALPYVRSSCKSAVIASAAGLTEVAARDSETEGVRSVGMVARLDPWKGQDLLLRAFASVFAGTPTRLLLAGSAAFGHESYADQLRQLSEELGIVQQVDFLGHVDDVPALISNLDICVQCSVRPEPLGQNVLQYLHGGRPTVAVNAGGPAEWIRDGENGMLFEMGDELSLVNRLEVLLNDPGLRKRLATGALATAGLSSDRDIAHDHLDFFRTSAGVSSK